MVSISAAQSETVQFNRMVRDHQLSAAVITEPNGIQQITPICKMLAGEGFGVDLVQTEELLTRQALPRHYDLALLDCTQFDDRGIHVCNALRHQQSELPIVVLSNEDSVECRIRGFENGADEFIAKPFVLNELSLRLKALMRRSGSVRNTNILKYGDLTLDLTSRVAYRGEMRIDLSRREFMLLAYMVQHAEKIVSRDHILEHVWSHTSGRPSNVVDVYINYLRNKIETFSSIRLLHTVRGKGYILHQRWMP